MKKITHVFGGSMVLAAVLSILVAIAGAQAKPEAAGSRLMGVTMVTIKPDMSPESEHLSRMNITQPSSRAARR